MAFIRLAPPPNADLLEYIPELRKVDGFQIYGGIPLGHGAPVAPNTMQRSTPLLWKVTDLAVETGSLNPDAPVGHFIREVRGIRHQCHEHSVQLSRISSDEALGKMLRTSQRGDGTVEPSSAGAASVAREILPWVREVAQMGLDVNLIEPFPVVNAGLLYAYLNVLKTEAPRARLSLTLDINWWRAMTTGPRNWGSPFWSWLWRRGWERYDSGRRQHYADIYAELRALRGFCRTAGIPFGVIIGSPFIPTYEHSDEGFYRSAVEQINRLEIAGIRLQDVDEFVVQSWWPFHMQPGETDVDQRKDRPGKETMMRIVDMVRRARGIVFENNFFASTQSGFGFGTTIGE